MVPGIHTRTHIAEGTAQEIDTPETDVSPELVRVQLEQLVADQRFASSPRCALLLRYVVEETMHGRAENLKERSIGIDVFKRPAHYDTSADPVVRIAASEVRKKLAQYYCEPENRLKLRVEIPVGTYAPRFLSLKPSAAALETSANHAARSPHAVPATPARRTIALAATALLLAASASGLFAWRVLSRRSSFDAFWAPLMKSGNPVLLCLGQMVATSLTPAPDRLPAAAPSPILFQSSAAAPRNLPVAVPNDSITLANIASLLRAQHRDFSAHMESGTSYQDLQHGPAVLIGGLNNEWTMYLMRNMRFGFARDPVTGQYWISDRQNPGKRLGLRGGPGAPPLTQDLAIVARVLAPETGQPAIIVAGLTSEGTLAAGNFLTSQQSFQEFARFAPPNWTAKNIEILLSTTIVDGQPGPARVVASTTW